jgi:Transposase IS4
LKLALSFENRGRRDLLKGQKTRWPQKSVDEEGRIVEKSALLAPTFALILRLASQLPEQLRFCVYLDNLFLNVTVAQCLLAIEIYYMGTTRKKAIGVPQHLQSYLNDNNELLWDSKIAEVVDNNTLCFVWQDNKPVFAITTAHSLHRFEDRIQRTRNCPKISSENACFLNPLFQGQPQKDLLIPKALDDYNHHMKGVDQADALRPNSTCHRKQNHRTWWPLFYFLPDIVCVNAYLLWKWSSTANSEHDSTTHNGHRAFMEALCTELLHSNDQTTEEEESHSLSVTMLQRHHKRVQEKHHSRCEWGKLHLPGCPRKRSSKRKFGTDITESTINGASKAILGGSRTYYKCSECQIWLCIKGSCWEQYHHSIGVNC